jgi:hypothetical protein
MPPVDSLAVSPVELLTTAEGEYAALVTLAFRKGEDAYERTIGLVWGDFFYSQIDAGTGDPRSFERFRRAARDLTYYHSLGLGELRRRRFRYTPPTGWPGYPRRLVTEWHHPGFPNEHGLIAVYPARPVHGTDAGELDRVLHEMSWFGFERESLDGPEAVFTDHKLTGVRWRPVGRYEGGPRLFYDVVVLQDERFGYVLRLETQEAGLEAHRKVFDAVVRSVRPLPTPAPPADVPSMVHWVS